MEDAAIYRICIDVVFAGDIEVSIRVWMNRSVGIAESAADVDMRGGIGGNQSGIVSSPSASDVRHRI